MRDFGVVFTRYWLWCKDNQVSKDASHIGSYLLSNPHVHSLGCYRLPVEYIVADLPWYTKQEVVEALRQLSEKDFCRYCQQTGTILLPKYLEYNPPMNPNMAKASAKQIATIPKHFEHNQELLAAVNGCVDSLLSQGKQSLAAPLQEACKSLSKRLGKPFGKPFGKPLGQLSPNTDPDPDPDPYTETDIKTLLSVSNPPKPGLEKPNPNPNGAFYAEIAKLYHETCTNLPPTRLTKDGKPISKEINAKLKARIDEYRDLESHKIAFWKTLFHDIAHYMPHLNGANDRGWVATLDWILGIKNMSKILNGNYFKAPPGLDKQVKDACEINRTRELIRKRKEARDGMAKRITPG